MKILITGAGGTVGRGIVPRLLSRGHDLVLSDVNPLTPPLERLPFVQCDIQSGFGLERAAAGCDLVLHLPAWHGIHSKVKTEIDYWRLNVDGTFWMFQAAISAGITRVVFLSSMAWHRHYNKYGFTKRVGEELCEYHRQNHAIRYIAVRPFDFTPWGSDYVNGYGTRLLRGGVDREDVLDCIERAIDALRQAAPGEAEGFAVNACRANAFDEQQAEAWERDPLETCEQVFPGSKRLVAKYGLKIEGRPSIVELGPDAHRIGYRPSRHFGTFLAELKRLDAEGGEAAVRGQRCPY